MRAAARQQLLRQRLAQEAARIIVTEEVADFLLAKRKAADRLHVDDDRYLPTNREIEAEVRAYQTLFQSRQHPEDLRRLREQAVEAMRFLSEFEPRLSGSVLTGTAGPHSDINLHLFASSPEQVVWRLVDAGIPYREVTRRVRIDRQHHRDMPAFRFMAGETEVELLVFAEDGPRQPPLSPVDGRPMPRARVAEVVALIDQGRD